MAPRPRAAKSKDQPGGRFLQMLQHLGWVLGTIAEARPLTGPKDALGRTTWRPLPLPDGQMLILLHAVKATPALTETFNGYEDFPGFLRRIQGLLATEGVDARYLLLTDDANNALLADMQQEDVLLALRGAEAITEQLLPHLNLSAVARGSLGSLPRKSLNVRARELRDWTRLWSARIGAASGAGRDVIREFFRWLLLARLAEQNQLMAARKVPFAKYESATASPKSARYFYESIRPLHRTLNLLQGHPLEVHREVARRAEGGGELDSCLRSFSRLSRAKFATEIFAEAFADEDLRQIGWRHGILGTALSPEEDPTRWLTTSEIVNLDELGFPGLLRAFDTITEALRKVARDQAVARERGERTGLQLDLLGNEPPTIEEEDAPLVALQHVLKVRTADKDRAEVARFVLLSFTAEWFGKLRRAAPVFPTPHVETRATVSSTATLAAGNRGAMNAGSVSGGSVRPQNNEKPRKSGAWN